jgi:predicted ArsR family transcriptional regulator
VLTALLETVVDTLPPKRADELLRDVGRRLARGTGGEASGTLEHRVTAAAAVLTALGGDVEVAHEDGAMLIRGSGCPLSAAVSHQPALCRTVETLVAEIVGSPVQQRCEHRDRPRCRFAIGVVGSVS